MFDMTVITIPWGDTKRETCKVYINDLAIKSPEGKWFKSPRFVDGTPAKQTLHNAVMTAAEFRTFPWNSFEEVRALPMMHDTNQLVVTWKTKHPMNLVSGRNCLAIKMFAEGNGDEAADYKLRAEGVRF